MFDRDEMTLAKTRRDDKRTLSITKATPYQLAAELAHRGGVNNYWLFKAFDLDPPERDEDDDCAREHIDANRIAWLYDEMARAGDVKTALETFKDEFSDEVGLLSPRTIISLRQRK